MTDGCAICGRGDSVTVGNHTLLDTSGGALIRLCRDCWEKVATTRYHICGGRCDPNKSRGIYSQAFEADSGEGGPPTYPVCDSCRIALLNGSLTEVDDE